MAHKITINLDLKGTREPELYAGIDVVPDVCRAEVIHSLLTLAIRTPYHKVASAAWASRHERQALEGKEGRISKKLVFASDRTADREIYAYFMNVPVGQRRQAARALLMKGLIVDAPEEDAPKPVAPAAAPVPHAAVAVQYEEKAVTASKRPVPPAVTDSLGNPPGHTPTAQEAERGRPSVVNGVESSVAQGGANEDDLDELFGAINVRP
jgi:hypothetical protein